MWPSPRRTYSHTGSTTRERKRTGGPNQARACRRAELPGFGASSARAAHGPAPLPPAGAGPGTKPGSGPMPPAPPHGHREAQNLDPRSPAERLPAPGPPPRHPGSGRRAGKARRGQKGRTERGGGAPLHRGGSAEGRPPPSRARLRPAPPPRRKQSDPARAHGPPSRPVSVGAVPPSPPSPRSRRHLTAPAASPSTAASSAPHRPTKRRRREASATGHAACFIPPPPPLPSGNSTARLGLPPPRRPLARGAPPGTAAHWGASAALTRHRPSAPSPLAPCGRARP